MEKILLVQMNNVIVGQIKIRENQQIEFLYDTNFLQKDDARALSLSSSSKSSVFH